MLLPTQQSDLANSTCLVNAETAHIQISSFRLRDAPDLAYALGTGDYADLLKFPHLCRRAEPCSHLEVD